MADFRASLTSNLVLLGRIARASAVWQTLDPYSSDLFGVTRVPRASGRTRTLRDHVINETPPNRVYRVYRSTAALHPSYLANICRDREGGSIPTKLVRSLLLSICLYVHTYMYVYVCQKCAPSYHTSMVIRLMVCVRVYVVPVMYIALGENSSIFCYALQQQCTIPFNEVIRLRTFNLVYRVLLLF